MEEKKLTDEEIVKALECCKKGETCATCPYLMKQIDCFYHQRAQCDALDLIKRLQREKKALEDLCNKTYDDLTKEIERLTEENDQTKDLLTNTVNELEKLKIENRLVNSYRTRIQELQKQVDELTDKLGTVLSGIKADELLVAKGIEQAVKDMAKEILQKIMNIIKKSNGFLAEEVIRIMAKQKGVEVE